MKLEYIVPGIFAIIALIPEVGIYPSILGTLLFILYLMLEHRRTFKVRVKEATSEHYMMTLRLLILSDEVPCNEKMKHYDDYKKLGGNSYIDNYITSVVIPQHRGILPTRRKSDHQSSQDE